MEAAGAYHGGAGPGAQGLGHLPAGVLVLMAHAVEHRGGGAGPVRVGQGRPGNGQDGAADVFGAAGEDGQQVPPQGADLQSDGETVLCAHGGHGSHLRKPSGSIPKRPSSLHTMWWVISSTETGRL